MTVKLPPLRERREDIPLLAAHFIKEFNQRHGKHVTGIAEPVRKAMAAYDWPGNVRELRNLIESMVVQDQDGVLGLDDLQEGDSLRRLQVPDDHAAGPGNLVGRPLDRGRALLHRADPGADRRQPRGGGPHARHRRADAVPHHPGLEAAGQDPGCDSSTSTATRRKRPKASASPRTPCFARCENGARRTNEGVSRDPCP